MENSTISKLETIRRPVLLAPEQEVKLIRSVAFGCSDAVPDNIAVAIHVEAITESLLLTHRYDNSASADPAERVFWYRAIRGK